MSAPVEDRTDPAALVPLVMRGPGEMGKLIQLIDLYKEMSGPWMEMRNEALQRLAAGLDIPPEKLTGSSGLNHWTNFQVDTEFVVKHVAPVGDLYVDFVTHAYFRPMLEEFEDMAPEDAGRFRLIFDVNPILSRADESNTARALWDRFGISTDAMIRHSGFDEADVVSDEELIVRRAWDLCMKSPYLTPYLLKLVPGFGDIDIEVGLGMRTANNEQELPGQNENEPRETITVKEDGPAYSPGGDKADIGSNPAGGGVAQTSPPGASAETTAMLANQLATAAHAALSGAVRRAATRVCTGKVRDAALRARIARIDKADVFTTLGPRDLRLAGFGPAELFSGCWDEFLADARGWVYEHLHGQGIDNLAADELAAAAASAMVNHLDRHLAEHLHDPGGLPVYPGGLRVPPEIVGSALTVILVGERV